MKLIYFLWVMLCPILSMTQNISHSNIHPLFIGDTVQDVTLSNVSNYPAANAKLSDFKGKVVILDFWGQYCSSCIQALNGMDTLQQSFGDKIKVISISDFTDQRALNKALQRYIHTKGFSLPVLLANDTLSKLFPHKIVSHVVWIASSGEIKAITGAEYVTKKNIQLVLDGKELNWPVKQDLASFDYTAPLLGIAQPDVPSPAFLYYNAFTGYIDGIAPPSGTFNDSAAKCTFACYYNTGLLGLCQLSVDGHTGADPNQFILLVKDTARYFKPAGEQYAVWREANAFCYYIRLPLAMDSQRVQAIIKQDISRWLAIMGIQVTKQVGKHAARYIITETNFKTKLQ